jgi:hypothetical protein
MAYRSSTGRKPDEYASKASHGYIIQDPGVVEFLKKCHLPGDEEKVDLPRDRLFPLEIPTNNPIKFVIAIDGGYTDVSVKKTYPSATLAFFQFGALFFKISDLEGLETQPFIDPSDIERLNNIERFKFSFPTKNINFDSEIDLINSCRRSLYDFFMQNPAPSENFLETLRWLVFSEFDAPQPEYNLASCPTCGKRDVSIQKSALLKDLTLSCPECHSVIFLTDIFRLHEAIDNELGAEGVLGYLTTLLEQIVLVHFIRSILQTKPALLGQTIFIKDGPLAFFGQTANMHKLFRHLMTYLQNKQQIFLVGIEKSGAFVEYATSIASKIPQNTMLLLDNDYIYKYIIPGKADPDNPYASTSYYGAKLIFRAEDDRIYVLTIPVNDSRVVLDPKKTDFPGLDVILQNVQKLKCDMYESSLVPIALANKLVSLANHPSAVILEKFAQETIG